MKCEIFWYKWRDFKNAKSEVIRCDRRATWIVEVNVKFRPKVFCDDHVHMVHAKDVKRKTRIK